MSWLSLGSGLNTVSFAILVGWLVEERHICSVVYTLLVSVVLSWLHLNRL